MGKSWEIEYLDYLSKNYIEPIDQNSNEYNLQYLIHDKIRMVKEADIPEEELKKRILFCIDNLPETEKKIVYAMERDKLSITAISNMLKIQRDKCRNYMASAYRFMISYKNCNILLCGIEEGGIINAQLLDSVRKKYNQQTENYAIEEKLYLMVYSSALDLDIKYKLIRAGIEDFSIIFHKSVEELMDYRGIGKITAEIVLRYIDCVYGN